MNYRHLMTTALLAGILLTSSAVVAGTWEGDESDDWGTSGNWSDNSVPSQFTTAPAAVFSGTPTVNQPTINGGIPPINGIHFQSGGWTISGAGDTLDIVPDAGITVDADAGTNVISAGLNDYGSPAAGTGGPVNIGANSTLVASGSWDLSDWWAKQGDGKLVLSGASDGNRGVLAQGGTILVTGSTFIGFNYTDDIYASANYEVTGTYGGTGTVNAGGGFTLKQVQFLNGSTLAPGGDGTYGAEIGTLTITSTGFQASRIIMDAGSTLAIDLGPAAGINDVIAQTAGAGSGGMDLTGLPTLALFGDLANPVAGDYTIATWQEGDVTGTFGDITYNGSDISSFVTVGYNANDITLSIAEIPEPATMGLLSLGGLALLRRRRK